MNRPVAADRIRAAVWRPYLCFGIFGVFWGSWAAYIPAIKTQTGASEGQLGIVLLVVATSAFPAMFSTGWLMDRFGARAMAPLAAAFGLAVFLPGLTGSPLMLALAGVALGATSGGFDVAINAVVAHEEERSQRRLMHAAHGIFSAGLVLGSVLGGLARAAGVGPRGGLSAVALSVLVVAGVMVATESPAVEVPRPDPDRRRVLFTAPLVILGGLCALAFVLEGAMEGWSALHLEQTLDAGPAVGGLGPALYGTAAAAGRLGAQSFASRIDDRPLMTVAALLAAAGASITAIAPTAAVAIAGMFVTGAGVSVAAPTIFSLAGRIVGPEQRGRALSTVAALSYVGFLLGPPMMGAIAEASDLRWAFASVAGVALLLGALMRFAPAAPRS